MKISVIIPTRNRSAQFLQALSGVALQRDVQLQLIVIDDGSSGEHATLNQHNLEASGLEFQYIHLPAYTGSGHGAGMARNIGLSAAHGDVVAFCDDDDYWCDPAFLSSAARAYQARPGLDVFFGNQRALRNGQLAYETWQPAFAARIQSRRREVNELLEVHRQECLSVPGDFPHLNSCVFRRDLLEQIGGFWRGVQYGEDLDLFVRLIDRARTIVYYDQTVSVHNIPAPRDADSASTRIGTEDKAHALHLVSAHLLLTCSAPESLAYARRLAGNSCRKLATAADAQGSKGTALIWARLALAWYPTQKWLMYVLLLRLKSLFNSRHQDQRHGPAVNGTRGAERPGSCP